VVEYWAAHLDRRFQGMICSTLLSLEGRLRLRLQVLHCATALLLQVALLWNQTPVLRQRKRQSHMTKKKVKSSIGSSKNMHKTKRSSIMSTLIIIISCPQLLFFYGVSSIRGKDLWVKYIMLLVLQATFYLERTLKQ
jgi:hypothetical protein